MSRGRARHQSNRRRMYSARQRDLRERRLRAAPEAHRRVVEELTAVEIDDGSEADATSLRIELRRGATAA
jgi:hypothetical protein